MPKPTLQEIADAAGVSRMTVSRALRNDPLVAEETRRRIAALAEDMGYRPDPKLSELMSYLRRTVKPQSGEPLVLLDPRKRRERYKNLTPTEERILAGARARADALGYRIDYMTWKPSEFSADRMRQILYTRGIRGVMILATRTLPEDLETLVGPFSTALLGQANAPYPIAQISNDHLNTIRLALKKITGLGYQRVGLYMTERTDEIVAHTWHAWLVFSQEKAGVHAPGLHHIAHGWDFKDFRDWLRENEPEVILTNHQRTREWLERCKLRVPEDVGLCIIDWTENVNTFAGVDQNSEQVGSAGVDVVVRQMVHNETGLPPFRKTVLIQSSWVDGSSIRAVRPATVLR
ncbi:MAG: LacI family DNA-binding transcriptional regulator [Opitutales bacterium]